MKTRVPSAIVPLLCAVFASAQAIHAQSPGGSPSLTILENGPHTTVWQSVSADDEGNTITNTYTEVATGLNFWNSGTSQFESSRESFQVMKDGSAIATNGQHQIILSAEINSAGSVDLLLPDGQRLTSNPMGLAFYDTASGKNVLIAEVTNCIGQLVASNVVSYDTAFDTLRAGIRYENSKAGLSQDIVLYQNPGSPADYGLNPASTVLEMWTEFHDPPKPVLTANSTPDGLSEQTVDFGTMIIGRGNAFVLNDGSASVPVGKTWTQIQDANGGVRTFLIEAVPFERIKPQLDRLQASVTNERNKDVALRSATSREKLVALEGMKPKQKSKEVASITPGHADPRAGLVVDYTTLNTSLTNYTFKGDTTYYLSGNVGLYGTSIVFEGGTVLKYATNVSLTANAAVTWLSSPYRPIVMSGKDDDSIGDKISGSTGNPTTNYYANPALQITTGNTQLHDLRVAHAQTGIFYYDYSAGNGNGVSHAQFVRCNQAMKVNGYGTTFQNFFARNVLMNNCQTAFYGYSFNGDIEHLTLNTCNKLADDYNGQTYGTTSSLSLTNSILVSVTNLYGTRFSTIGGDYNGFYGCPTTFGSHQVSASSNPFQTVGQGAHYLADNTFRDAGTSGINASLAGDLRKRTTFPPLVLTGDFNVNTTLSPQALRDTDPPDLGYHYDPLDYCWSGLNLTNATLTLTNGVAVGIYGGKGTLLRKGAIFVSEGDPLHLNRIVRYQLVQEQSTAWGTGTVGGLFDLPANYSPAPVLRLTFSDLSVPSGALELVSGFNSAYNALNTCAVSHSQLRGISQAFRTFATGCAFAFTNNLMERSTLTFEQGYTGFYTFAGFSLSAYNNLLHGAPQTFKSGSGGSAWTIKDNLFDADSVSVSGTYNVTADYNGYRSGLSSLGGTHNKTIYNLDYQTSFLGGFYYPTTGTNLAGLINAGSRNATNAALYHFTTTTNQVKETNTTVDIGYHYVALNASNVPVDSDSDGLADYLEDRNGDGTYNTGDVANWTVADSDSDGMPDGWEFQYGLNPLVNDASDDPDGDGYTNYQEYVNGTNPNDPWIVAWGANSYGQGTAPAGLGGVSAIDGGLDFTVALKSNHVAVAWGHNNYGQTNVPSGLSNLVTAVSASWYQAAALKGNGTVATWGATYGQIPGDLTNAVSVSLGWAHGIALRADGTVSVWGDPSDPGSTNLSGLTGVKAVATGWEHNVALLNNSTVVAWGANYGLLGWNITNVPPGLTNVIAIAAGGYHTLALKNDGTVVAWGAGQTNGGYLGDEGQSIVPAGLSNVIAIAGGGYNSMALRSDGTVVAWGELGGGPIGLNNVVAIGAGDGHCLAERVGRQTPLITTEPEDQCALTGTNVTFSASAIGPAAVSYQWQFNSVNINGATNGTLTLTNVQSGNQGTYRVIASNGAGSTTSQGATLNLVGAPTITSQTQPSTFQLLYGATQSLGVQATYSGVCPVPLSYAWTFNSNFLYAPSATNYTITNAANASAGVYSVTITNGAGSTNTSWTVNVAGEGSVVWWGSITQSWTYLPGVTNTLALAGGGNHTLAVKDGGAVIAWGTNNYGQTNVPANLTNGMAVAAGDSHSLALKTDGTVIAWGRNDLGQTNVPANVTNVVAISAGGQQSLALKKDGTVVQWGQTFGSVPASLTNAISIASGTNFHVALRTNGTVVAWGNNASGQTNVPSGLTNVVGVAAGGAHALALKVDGTVVAWGSNSSGQTNVPANLTNAMAVAAGYAHSLALRNDGTVIAWGDNTYGQTNTPSLLAVKLIAAGGYQSLASIFSPLVQYPVDVTKDLLLICNTNSTNSAALRDYYLAHRPLVANANVLNVACDVGEFITTNNFASQIVTPVLNWLAANPTKHPEYILLFFDIPTRITPYPGPDYGSVSYHLQQSYPGWKPFVTYINAGTLADCEAYVDKLAYIGTNYSAGKLILSASGGSYGNTNYVVDNIRHGGAGYKSPPYPYPEDFSDYGGIVSRATNGLVASGVSTSAIIYADGIETITNGVPYNLAHLTNAANVAGYISWGAHSSLGPDYATNGPVAVHWSGNSRWWIIETIESYNGQRLQQGAQGSFIKWLSSNAFGGTSYSNTPVGAVSHVEEPGPGGVNNTSTYFGLWASGKNLAISAWNSRNTPFFQMVGDPLVTR